MSDQTRKELKSAVTQAKKRGVEPCRREDFPLSSFASTAAEIRRRLADGIGFVVLRGLPLDDYAEDEAKLLYAGIGTHLGTILPQNLRGDRLYSVRDEGIRVEADYGQTGVRFSKTNAAFDFHTDSPSRVAGHTPDTIGLLVLRSAKTGGESALVSAYTLHNILREERPDVLRRLYQPFWVDRRAELPPGEDPVLPVPVSLRLMARSPPGICAFILRRDRSGRGEPLTGADVEALDAFDNLMQRSPALP